MVYLAIKNGWIFPWRTVSHNQMVNLHSFTCDTTLAPWNVSETFQKHQGYFSSYPMTDPAGAGILMLTWLGYIDGIHGTPYIAAPWIPWVLDHDPFMSSTWYGETPNLIPSWSAIKNKPKTPGFPNAAGPHEWEDPSPATKIIAGPRETIWPGFTQPGLP